MYSHIQELQKQLIVEHGCMDDAPNPDNHKCAGSVSFVSACRRGKGEVKGRAKGKGKGKGWGAAEGAGQRETPRRGRLTIAFVYSGPWDRNAEELRSLLASVL